tara:strand:+ start:611 stop:1267 length:657 start_codon:yes stop_codon:yes gene_type:complete
MESFGISSIHGDEVKSSPPYWEEAKKHLRISDPIIGKLIDQFEEPSLQSKGELFETLVRSIVGQQISAIAADAIWKRFCDAVSRINPEAIESLSDQEMRDTGLSFRKIEYIRGIAESWPRLKELDWEKMADDEIRNELIQLRGIGPWTIDMILIFNLMRPDVLPLGDIGIVRMIEKLYANKESLSQGEMTEIAGKWAPFRTVATWYLWRDLDPEPVQY